MKLTKSHRFSNKQTGNQVRRFHHNVTQIETRTPTPRGSITTTMEAGLDFGHVPVFPSPHPIQAKLTLSEQGDHLEREADRVADQAVGSFEPARPGISSATHITSPQAPPIVRDVLSTGGQPLDRGVRDKMGSRLGHDFSQVRVHTGSDANDAARSIRARAFTSGQHIVFGGGQFSPAQAEGRRLLAHELTHVVQQSRSTGSAVVQRDIEPEPAPGDAEHTSPSPSPSEYDDALPNQLASFDFVGGRLKRFKALERFAPKLKAIIDSDPSAVIDIVSLANLRTPGRSSDPAEGLLTLLTVWFNLPKKHFRTRRMVIDQPPKGMANTEGYAKAVVVYPGGTGGAALPGTLLPGRLPIVPPSSSKGSPGTTGAEASGAAGATSGLDIDIDVSKITDHDIDIEIGTTKIRIPSSVEEAFEPINLAKGTSLHISVKSSLDLEMLFGGMLEDEEEAAAGTQPTPPEEEKTEIPVQPSFAASIVINGTPQITISAAPNFNLSTGEVGAGVGLSLSGGGCHYVVPAASVDALRAAPAEFQKISDSLTGAEIGVSEAAKLAQNVAKVYDAVKKIEEAKTSCQAPNIEFGASVKRGERPSPIPGDQPIPELRADASLKFRFDVPGAIKSTQRGPDYDWELKWHSLPKTDLRLVRPGTLLIAQFAARESGHIELVKLKGDAPATGDWLIDSQNIDGPIKSGFVEFTAPKVGGRYEIRLVDKTGFAYGTLAVLVSTMPKPKSNRPRYDKAGPNASRTDTA
jgi:hypothetical protein